MLPETVGVWLPLPRILHPGSLMCPQPQTPHLEEDLKEVLRSEAGIELIIEDEVRPEKQKRKPGVSGQGRESLLLPAWVTWAGAAGR